MECDPGRNGERNLGNTYWTSSGPVSAPFDWTKSSLPPSALVLQPDGSFQTVQGTGNSDGTFSIPNIPGGYYWLRPGAAAYWTSSSTFDFGFDGNTQAPSSVTTNTTTTGIHFNLSGLDPLQAEDEMVFLWDLWPPFSLPFFSGSPAGATTLTVGALITSNIDFSQSGTAFLLQYEPETFGTMSALKLGPEVTLQGLALVNGVSNTVNGPLVQSPQTSFDLNVKGSAWAPLFSNAGPSPPTVEGADLEVTAEAFMTGGNLLSFAGLNIPLLVDLQRSSPPSFELLTLPTAPVCARSGPIAPGDFTFLPGEPPVTTDQDFGTVQYGDPFPTTWPRVFTFCQTASVPIPLPGSTNSVSFRLVDAQGSPCQRPRLLR